MNRRNFLGSVIGLWASQDFFARLASEPAQVNSASIADYFLLFRDNISGFTVRAPGIRDIDSKVGSWTFIANDLHVTQPLRVSEFVLCNQPGRRIAWCRTDCVHNVTAGDIFKAKMTLDIPWANTSDLCKAALALTGS